MKTIFENNGGAYMQAGDYLLPNLSLSAEEKRNEYLCMGNEAQTIFETKPQSALLQFADKRSAQFIPCRHRRTSRKDVL